MALKSTTLFCFGHGYSAMALARRMAASGSRIIGTRRDEESVAALRRDGIEAYLFDGRGPLDQAGCAALHEATHVLISIPPTLAGDDPVLQHHGRNLGEGGSLRWLGYLSTTGVYGDRGGAWVDETTTPSPSGERGAARLMAENAWLELWRQRGVPAHIFRLAGIYGPGRSAFDSIKDGSAKRIDKPGQVFSRIHVEDIAETLLASMAQPDPGRIYNVCDDAPAPPAEVVAFACALLGKEPPALVAYADIEATLSPMARSFYAENKRVSNARIKNELGVRLRYPDYRSGLKAILDDERRR